MLPQASTIVPGPPSTESIERTYHSPITDAERAVTHQSQHARSTSCQRTCATLAALGWSITERCANDNQTTSERILLSKNIVEESIEISL
jgi:hypothetical protein